MPVAAMSLAVLCWSAALVGNKALLATLSVTEVAFSRMSLAAVILWAALAIRGELARARVGRGPWLMGVLEPGMTGLLVIWGISLTAASHAAVLWALTPVAVPLMAHFALGERLRPVVAVAAMLALSGTAILLAGGASRGEGSLAGDLLCIAGVSCSCVNAVLARSVAMRAGGTLPTTATQMLAAAMLALFALLAIERPAVAPETWTGETLAIALFLGAIGSAAPFFLYNYALRRIPAGQTALFAPLVGPVGAVIASLWIGEPIGPHLVAAMGLILFGAFLPAVFDRLRRQSP